MIDEFAWHAAALKGERGPISADDPQSGFYRTKSGRDGPLVPVAFWYDSHDGNLRCHKNGKSLPDLEARELWVYASKNPITAEAYWHRMDTGTWMDNDASAAAAAKGPEIDPGTNGQNAEESLKAEIAAALKNVPNYAVIESDEAAAKAQTLRSLLTTLKGSVQKRYNSWSEPLLGELAFLRNTWFPIRDSAADGADAIRKAMGKWEDIKRENAVRAQFQTENAAAIAALAHAKAVEKAAERNEPPPPPPEPAPQPAVNTPPPSTKIKGASGRAASVQLKKVVVAIDLDKAFAQFRNEPELYAFLLDLSQRVVTAGYVAIGATVEEKSDIR